MPLTLLGLVGLGTIFGLIIAAVWRAIATRDSATEDDFFFAASIDLLCVAGTDGYFKQVNPSFTRVTGWSREELLTRPNIEFCHPEDRPETQIAVDKFSEGAETHHLEARFLCKDGSWKWLSWTSGGGRNGQGYSIARDVTEQKRGEQNLRANVEELTVFQSVLLEWRDHELEDLSSFLAAVTSGLAAALRVERAGIWVFDSDQTAIECSDLYLSTTGEHQRGKRLLLEEFPRYFHALAQSESILADDAYTHPATSEFGSVYLAPLGIASMLDVPIRKGARVVGVLCCEHVGPARHWTAQENKFAVSAASYVMLAVEQVERRQVEAERKQAEQALVESERRLRELNENLERLVAERTGALRASEEHHRSVIECMNEGLFLTDLDDVIVEVNPQMLKLTGYTRDELVGRSALEAFIAPDEREQVRARHRRRAENVSEHGEQLLRRKDGSQFWALIGYSPLRNANGAVVGAIGASLDITAQKSHENLARRSQRLEAIGMLAGGVAHDLNNALSPIVMGLEILRDTYPQEDDLLDLLAASATRGATMVRQLLTFAKGGEGNRVAVDIGRVVRELANVMNTTFPKNLQMIVLCAPTLPSLLGDATQLHQVLLNLCVNARDAMPRGGKLTLEALAKEVTADDAREIPEMSPGRYVVLRVRDTGTGIPPEILDRIFDPFFSTKGLEQGTGLGLATVLGIVRGHGGFLQVESPPGKGATFSVYLPVDVAAQGVDEVPLARPQRGQGEMILLVDDEAAVREVGCAVLRRLNFTPLTATDGVDGLMQAAQHHAKIRAIITDQNMPHMDGLAFVRNLRRIFPNIPVLVASGRIEEATFAEFHRLGVTLRLDKPFTEAQLAAALHDLD